MNERTIFTGKSQIDYDIFLYWKIVILSPKGLPTKNETPETTVQNLYCLFPYIHDSSHSLWVTLYFRWFNDLLTIFIFSGKGIINEQFLLSRLADVTIDLYSMTCVLSRYCYVLHDLCTVQVLLYTLWLVYSPGSVMYSMTCVLSRYCYILYDLCTLQVVLYTLWPVYSPGSVMYSMTYVLQVLLCTLWAVCSPGSVMYSMTCVLSR